MPIALISLLLLALAGPVAAGPLDGPGASSALVCSACHGFAGQSQSNTMEAKARGAKVAVLDTRLSNTASMADWWLAPWPGSESAVLLAIAHVLVREKLYDRDFVRRWVNWDEYLRAERPELPVTFEAFDQALDELYARFTPEFAEAESGVAASTIVEVAREIGRAGSALATHVWRNTAAGNLGGWQVARALELVVVLMKGVGTRYPKFVKAYRRVMSIEDFLTMHAPERTGREMRSESNDNLNMSVLIKRASNGLPVSVDLESPEARAAMARGKATFHRKVGERNHACADCHTPDAAAGKFLSGRLLADVRTGLTRHFPTWRTDRAEIWDMRERRCS